MKLYIILLAFLADISRRRALKQYMKNPYSKKALASKNNATSYIVRINKLKRRPLISRY